MVHPSLVLTASVCWLCSGAGTVTAIKAHPEPCTGRSLSACGPTNTLAGTWQTCVFSRGDCWLTLTAVPTFWLPSLAPVRNSVPPLPTGLCFGHFLPGH